MTFATSNLLVLNLLPLKFESIPPKAITKFYRHETSAHFWCERGCETGDSQRICISGRLYVYILILWVWINAKHLSLQCQLSFRSLKAEPHLNAFMRWMMCVGVGVYAEVWFWGDVTTFRACAYNTHTWPFLLPFVQRSKLRTLFGVLIMSSSDRSIVHSAMMSSLRYACMLVSK